MTPAVLAVALNCGPNGARTRDLHADNVALFQLSHKTRVVARQRRSVRPPCLCRSTPDFRRYAATGFLACRALPPRRSSVRVCRPVAGLRRWPRRSTNAPLVRAGCDTRLAVRFVLDVPAAYRASTCRHPALLRRGTTSIRGAGSDGDVATSQDSNLPHLGWWARPDGAGLASP